MAVKLELMGKILAKFEKTGMVEVNNLLKFNCIPLEFPTFESQVSAINVQQEQLANIIDYIVGDKEEQNSVYRNFRNHMKDSTTL